RRARAGSRPETASSDRGRGAPRRAPSADRLQCQSAVGGGRERAGDRGAGGGPRRLHPTAGAVLLGVRRPLIAFNVNLLAEGVESAREIARLVRERDGGFPGVRALGLDLPSAGLVQVSMNVTDWEAAALHDIVERIDAEARARGAEVVGSELVGLM